MDTSPERGRPSIYTPELAEEIFQKVREGWSLLDVCDLDHMPCYTTLFNWKRGEGIPEEYHSDFLKQLTLARYERAFTYEEEIPRIADDGRNDWMERESKSGNTYEVVNHEAIARSKLRIETRRYLIAKAEGIQPDDQTPRPFVDAPPGETREEWEERRRKHLAQSE